MEKEISNFSKWKLNFSKTNLSLSVLLWLLVLTVFVLYPITDKGLFSEVVFVCFIGLIFLSGIFSITHKKSGRAIAIGFTFLLLPAAIVILSQRQGVTNIIMLGILIIYLVALALLLLKKVFTEDIGTLMRIQGAIAAYILFALIFSFAYRISFLVDNSSILFRNIQNAAGKEAPFEFLYFSFIILTTMGYGQVYPVGHFAQSLAMIESLLGILFPSVLIAKLMSMGHFTKKDNTASKQNNHST